MREPTNGSNTKTMSIAHLRAGRYTVIVERAGVRAASVPLVVER
jgi:hypothetical protein